MSGTLSRPRVAPNNPSEVVTSFTKFPNWVFKSRLSLSTRMVYLVLLSYDWHDKNVVWPSVSAIAEKASISKRTAYKALGELEEAGLITPEARYADFDQKVRRSNRYALHKLSADQIQTLCRSAPVVADAAPAGAIAATVGADSALRGAPDALPGAPGAHEEDKEKQDETDEDQKEAD